MKNHRQLLLFSIIGLFGLLCSCSISNQSMKTPNYHIEFYKTDFEYSNQVTAEATSVRILMIDWQRLFKWDIGNLDSDIQNSQSQNIVLSSNVVADHVVSGFSSVIPVLGDFEKGQVSTYALYKLMKENPGYDVVIYPQYEVKKFVIPLFYSKRTAKVTARLGKIK
jgi:hypothetical protein